MVYFLLNTLHKIVSAGSYYCYCDEEKCKICTIPVIFIDFEIDVEKNIFDYNFLFWYYTKLCNELVQLLSKSRSNAFRASMNSEARKSIRYNEQIQVNWLKREKLPISPEFPTETTDLSCPDV